MEKPLTPREQYLVKHLMAEFRKVLREEFVPEALVPLKVIEAPAALTADKPAVVTPAKKRWYTPTPMKKVTAAAVVAAVPEAALPVAAVMAVAGAAHKDEPIAAAV